VNSRPVPESLIGILSLSVVTSVSAGGFSPLSVSGIRLWVAADSLGLSAGSPVSVWPDQSGSGNTIQQGIVSQQPLYQQSIPLGMPIVSFNKAASQLLTNAAPSGLSALDPSSFFVVFNRQSTSSSLLSIGTSVGITNAREYGIGGGNNLFEMCKNAQGCTQNATGIGFGTFHLLTHIYTNSSVGVYYIDGVPDSLINPFTAGGFSAPQILAVGGASTTGGQGLLDGEIGEMIFWNREITQTEIDSIHCYFQKKYPALNVAGSCP